MLYRRSLLFAAGLVLLAAVTRINADGPEGLEARVMQLEKEIKVLKKQVEACTIKAPIGGMVIYSSSSSKSRYRREGEPIGEGATVYEGMRLIKIPRSTQMMADVRVHESQMKMIQT